ncbi:MAG: hypothetical protein E7164_04545 [Firmicutes bacterium]|nr:hypothetical protein [Bacillota bacterium]
MRRVEKHLTVDDLIVEYMIYKIKHGYNPSFWASEFISFLHFFEINQCVEDVIYDKKELFQRFFERKIHNDWTIKNGENTIADPHMIMEYCKENDDILIKPTYKLSTYDVSLLNTFLMSHYENMNIQKIIETFLSNYPKREIDLSVNVSPESTLIGKNIAGQIIIYIWSCYIQRLMETKNWPRQCTDIQKYLLEVDLAEIIGVKSIKKDLLSFYDVLSRKIAVLYDRDKELHISSSNNVYLSVANYNYLILGFEELISTIFGNDQCFLDVNLSNIIISENREINNIYAWDDDYSRLYAASTIDNVKKLVKVVGSDKKDMH